MIMVMTNPDDGRLIQVNGVSLYVEDHGEGVPVLLIHGWPDSARLWRHQVPVLVANGYRVITPDMRGFGRSERPAEVAGYGLRNLVAPDDIGSDDSDAVRPPARPARRLRQTSRHRRRIAPAEA